MESSEELVVAWFPLPWNRGGCKQGTCNAKQTMITYLYDRDSGSGPVSKRCGSGTGSGTMRYIRFSDPHRSVFRCSNCALIWKKGHCTISKIVGSILILILFFHYRETLTLLQQMIVKIGKRRSWFHTYYVECGILTLRTRIPVFYMLDPNQDRDPYPVRKCVN